MSFPVPNRRAWLAGLLAVTAAACVPKSGAVAPAGSALEPLEIVTDAGVRRFKVEVADDPAERTRGLMFRERLPAEQGMLFDFGASAPRSFWMKNTLVPLDIIFIGEDGRVRNVAANTIPFSEAPVPSSGPVRYVLEINAGLAAQHGIHPGDRVRHRLIPGG
jgi:uncharacterized membrane protein (UPF0127 family)